MTVYQWQFILYSHWTESVLVAVRGLVSIGDSALHVMTDLCSLGSSITWTVDSSGVGGVSCSDPKCHETSALGLPPPDRQPNIKVWPEVPEGGPQITGLLGGSK